jgi:hypothetical protein
MGTILILLGASFGLRSSYVRVIIIRYIVFNKYLKNNIER